MDKLKLFQTIEHRTNSNKKRKNELKVIPGPASVELGEKICELTGFEQVSVAARIFPDCESYVRLESGVQNDQVAIVQTTCAPQDTRLMQLAFLAHAAKRNGASKVTAVTPYLAYARQDKIFLPGETVSIEAIAAMLKAAGVDSLITVNVHSEPAIARFPFPAKTISAIPLLAEYFIKKGIDKAFALSPDKGAIYIAQQAQVTLGGELGYLQKERDRYTGQTKHTAAHLNVKGQTVIIFDDIISTGGTIVSAAKILREQGATHVYVACVHGLLIGDAEKRILDAGVEEIVSTDSVPNKNSKVSLSPLLAQELKAQI